MIKKKKQKVEHNKKITNLILSPIAPPLAHFINPQGHAGTYAAWAQAMDACMGWHTRGMMAGAQKVCSPGGAKGFFSLATKRFFSLRHGAK